LICSVAAAERSWYSDDEDENQDENPGDDVKNDAQNLPATTVSHVTTVRYLLDL